MGNTVGSRGVLTARQREILIGTLLGDGHLEKNGQYTRLRVDHYDKHKAYVFWLAQEFLPFSLKPRRILERDKRNGKIYSRWHFSTRSLPIFDEFRELFYSEKKKIISRSLINMVSPLALAIWYMDDGFKRKDSRGFYLCTSSFTIEEQDLLQEILRKRFDLGTKIHFQHQLGRIFIPSASAVRFNTLVKPYVLPVFNYKLL
ncbi:MAG: hypothetical protein M1484_04765 [Patescibacteria group bacterium]|nr:hypothetical protein [Patescibacteria group bacterium]